jgi:hypothetical protein
MRAKYRATGGIITSIVLAIISVILITQPNYAELWVAIAFTSAFSVGMLIYAKSNWTEKKRLATEKDKRKGKGKKK